MAVAVEVLTSRTIWVPPAETRLDEAVWEAWVAKGRAQDRRSKASSLKAVKWIASAALLAAAVFSSQLAPYDVAVRFVVAVGAAIVMFQAFHAKYYAVGAVFGALALLYNPVLPVFDFSGDWQRAVLAVSAVPFLASLAWRHAGTRP